MRRLVNDYLKEHGIQLLHPDVWPFDGVNLGVRETAIASVALGMAEHGPVAVYGIAGFVLLKAAEVIKLYKPKHSIVIFNAGHNGCYPKAIGYGHQIDYDAELGQILGYDVVEPDYDAVAGELDRLFKTPGWHLLRLGFDRPQM